MANNDSNKTSEAPGEVRNNFQIVILVLVALVVIALVGGFIWAVFLRPERMIEEAVLPALHTGSYWFSVVSS